MTQFILSLALGIPACWLITILLTDDDRPTPLQQAEDYLDWRENQQPTTGVVINYCLVFGAVAITMVAVVLWGM